VGDPVIVSGRLHTSDWIGDDKIRRQTYELDASAVGHDLSRGFDKFTRRRASVSTSATEDAETDRRVAGEVAEPMPELNNRALTQSYDEELGGFITSVEPDRYGADDDLFTDEVLSGFPSGDDYPDEAARVTSPTEDDDRPDGDENGSEDDTEGGDGGDVVVEPSRKRRRRQPVGV
jgi:single-strand DNA-binding protein